MGELIDIVCKGRETQAPRSSSLKHKRKKGYDVATEKRGWSKKKYFSGGGKAQPRSQCLEKKQTEKDHGMLNLEGKGGEKKMALDFHQKRKKRDVF